MRFLLLSICIYLSFLVAWQLPRARYIFSFSTLILKRGLGKKKDFAQLTSSVLESSLQQVWDPARFQSDPSKLPSQLLRPAHSTRANRPATAPHTRRQWSPNRKDRRADETACSRRWPCPLVRLSDWYPNSQSLLSKLSSTGSWLRGTAWGLEITGGMGALAWKTLQILMLPCLATLQVWSIGRLPTMMSYF